MKKSTKIFLYVLVFLLSLTAIFFASLYIVKNMRTPKVQEIIETPHVNVVDKNINNDDLFTVSGEVVCLPVKDLDKPHNDLCLIGIKDVNDSYYRLQLITDEDSDVIIQMNQGDEVVVSGTYLNEVSDVYESLGTIKVKDVRFLDREGDYVNSNLPTSFTADFASFSNYSLTKIDVEDFGMPGLNVANGEIDCIETNMESSFPLRINKKEINEKKYCIMASSEGAAGSTYTEYAYTTVIAEDVYLVRFLGRYTNCSNYPDEEMLKCNAERESFDLDILVDQEVEKAKKLV